MSEQSIPPLGGKIKSQHLADHIFLFLLWKAWKQRDGNILSLGPWVRSRQPDKPDERVAWARNMPVFI